MVSSSPSVGASSWSRAGRRGGRIVLRATGFPIPTVRELADIGVVLAALDLAESLDVRERRAGLDALTDALEQLRG